MPSTASLAPPSSIAYTLICGAINRLLARETWAQERLAPHAGKTIRFDATPIVVDLTVLDRSSVGGAVSGGVPDLTLSVPVSQWPQLMSALAAGDGDRAVLRHARVSGDADLAATVALLAKHLRWDVEDDLARIIGDAPAHRAVATLDRLRTTATDGAQRAISGFVAFLTQEDATLVAAADGKSFTESVRTLRDDFERLEKRVARLQSPR